MPGYQSGVAHKIGPGESYAVLNAEDLAHNTATMAVQTKTGYGAGIPMSIINQSGQVVLLEAAAVNTEAGFVAWENIGQQPLQPGTNTLGFSMVTGGLFYRIFASTGDIAAGTIWISV